MISFMSSIDAQSRKDGQLTEVGIDITSVVFKKAFCFTLGHGLSKHWSLEGTSTVSYGILTTKYNSDEKIHYGELNNDTDFETTNSKLVTGGIRIKYWINDIYKGGYIMTGIRSETKLDWTIGGGYSIHVFKGVCCGISYEIDIRNSIQQNRLTGNGISIALSYTY